MKKFTAKEIKEKFVIEQVSSNLEHVKNRINQNRSLEDTFYDFSLKEGFTLERFDAPKNTFNFSAFLSKELNADDNDGQIFFSKEDFEQEMARQTAISVVKESLKDFKKKNPINPSGSFDGSK